MSEVFLNCDLKLLSAAKDVGLRRWRSFAAALGGNGQMFHTAAELLEQLSSHQGEPPLVLYDQSLALSSDELSRLAARSRLLILRPPQTPGDVVQMPPKTAPEWRAEAYLQCSLSTLLDSPVLRMGLTQLVLSHSTFEVEHLLRWGYAAATCSRGGTHLAAASQAFIRSLNLTGEARRLTEMFAHLVQARLPLLNITSRSVTFGSDGILTLATARCSRQPQLVLADLAAELRVPDLPIVMINHLPHGELEIAGLFHPHAQGVSSQERILLVFNKNLRPLPPIKLQDDGAGQDAGPLHPHTSKAS